MRIRRFVAAALLLLPGTLAAGCGSADEPAGTPADDASMDGLSPEQIREQAEPMSLEEARARGIVDTTIHVEQLTSPDDSALLVPPPTPAAADTPR